MNEQMISHDGPGHRFLAGLSSKGVRYGLDRIVVLLEALGRPQDDVPVVVVAGTNGKGSVSAMLAAMLHGAGLRVGHFTSPHLVETRERMRVGDRCVSAEDLDTALRAVRDACATIDGGADDVVTTPFEALTAAALWLFRQRKLDMAVLECGLGGRLDATNATDPFVSVVTSIAYDHTRTLGRTLAAIATEKSHVGRQGRPLIVAQPSIVVGAARRAGIHADFRKLGWDLKVRDVTGDGLDRPPSGVLEGPMLAEPMHVEVGLGGPYQVDNAALAVMAYVEVSRHREAEGQGALPEPMLVADALATVPWPARCEWLSAQPPVVLDGGHNESGLTALANLLELRSKRWQVILAIRDNRSAEPLMRALAPIVECFWLPHMDAANLHPAAHLAEVAGAVAPRANVAVASKPTCLRGALAESAPGAGVAITGSLYGLGEWLQSGLIQSPRLKRWLDGPAPD